MTDKHLTKTLLINAKWIPKKTDDDFNSVDHPMPYHIVSYCRTCDGQHCHNKFSETNTGAWYYCVACSIEVKQ